MQLSETAVLKECAKQGETFLPSAVVAALGLSTDKHGMEVRTALGVTLRDLEARRLVDWTIDPVSGLKAWRLTEAGLRRLRT